MLIRDELAVPLHVRGQIEKREQAAGEDDHAPDDRANAHSHLRQGRRETPKLLQSQDEEDREHQGEPGAGNKSRRQKDRPIDERGDRPPRKVAHYFPKRRSRAA